MLTYRPLTQLEYVEAVVNCIAKTEGHVSIATDIGDNKATIGYGYTFERNNNVAIWQATGISLTTTQWSVLADIDAATTNASKRSIALSQFTKILTSAEAKELLRETYQKYEGPSNDLNMPTSWERVAFVSITYNRGEATVRRKMSGFYDAVHAYDRAEAWYQIRYNAQTSNPDYKNGIAKRRYYESELFGLYDDPAAVSQAEAIAVYRMFTAHRDKIESYEKLYGIAFNGALGTQLIGGIPPLLAAGRDYGLTPAQTPNSIDNELFPAAQVLLAAYVTTPGYGLASDFTALNIQVTSGVATSQLLGEDTATRTGSNRDLLIGGDNTADYLNGQAGDDVLYGGGGNDWLVGGKGNDTLNGGAGQDIYYWATGDGSDKIIDPDGGWIVINDTIIASGVYFHDANGGNVWRRTLPDNSVLTLTHNSPWTLVMADGSTIQLGENQNDFQSGDYGIHLVEQPTTTAAFTGADAYSDALTGTGGADLIQGLSGNDALDGGAGDDVIEGGQGDDLIAGGAGRDILHGGAGRDMILSCAGLDLPPQQDYDHDGHLDPWAPPADAGAVWTQGRVWGIYADADDPSIEIVDGGGALQPDSAPDTVFAEDGDDKVVSGLGDDYLDGGKDNDKLWGHGGNDVLVGGDGDDLLWGDDDDETKLSGQYHGADTLDGGAGQDQLVGGGGNDALSGGVDNDVLYGDARAGTQVVKDWAANEAIWQEAA